MKKIERTLRIAICGQFLGHGVFALPSRSSFSATADGITGRLKGNGSDGSPRDRDHRFYDRSPGSRQTDPSGIAVGSHLGTSDGTGAPSSGREIWDFVERWPNWGIPLALLFVRGIPRNGRDWLR